jgi:hypothetical protein
MFDMLAPDLMGPSTLLLFNLLFVSVVDVNDTGSPGCRSKRSRNLIHLYHSFLREIFCFEMSNGAGSEIIGGARILVGLDVSL